MGLNIGGFMGGLAQGINQGMAIRKMYQDEENKTQIKDLYKEGMSQAEKDRQAAIEGGVTTKSVADDGGLSNAIKQGITPVSVQDGENNPNDPVKKTTTKYAFNGQNFDTPDQAQEALTTAQNRLSNPNPNDPVTKTTTKYMVGDQEFTNADEARSASEKKAGSVQDYFMKNAVPKIRDAYLAQGNPEKAAAFDKWASDRKSQKAMEQWGKAYAAAQNNDWDSAAKNFGQYYTDNIDDGVDYVGHNTVMGADGQVSKFTLEMRKKGSKDTFQMEMTPQDMLRLGMQHNPQALFESENAKANAAAKLKGEMATEAYKSRLKENADTRNDARTHAYKISEKGADFKFDMAKLSQQQQNKLEEIGFKANVDAAQPGNVAKDVRDLKNAGFDDDAIKGLIGNKYGTTGKALDYTHARLNAFKALSDPNNMTTYGEKEGGGKKRWNDLTDQEKEAALDKQANMIIRQPASAQGIGKTSTQGGVQVWRP